MSDQEIQKIISEQISSGQLSPIDDGEPKELTQAQRLRLLAFLNPTNNG